MIDAIPEEIEAAVAAYVAAGEQIRDRVEANRRRYHGTKYEDCPPMLPEQLAMMVRHRDLLEEHRRLEERYGPCPRQWAFAVVWFKGRAAKHPGANPPPRRGRTRKVPNKGSPADAKKRRG